MIVVNFYLKHTEHQDEEKNSICDARHSLLPDVAALRWSVHLLMLINVPGSLIGVGLRLLHQVGDGPLQVVDARAHLIDARDDVVRHRLEPRLHLSQHLLH